MYAAEHAAATQAQTCGQHTLVVLVILHIQCACMGSLMRTLRPVHPISPLRSVGSRGSDGVVEAGATS